jgi:hypothetical protein
MGRLASAADFEGGLLYTDYRNYSFFADRALKIKGRVATGKVLVAGCGWGFAVGELLSLGIDAWGCDASPYALGKAVEVLPVNASARVILADCTSRTQLSALKTAAGLPGNQRFAFVVTEDLLPCLDNEAEVAAVLTELRRIGVTLFHIVTPKSEGNTAPLLWRTLPEWKALVGNDLVMSAESGQVI